jgi:hypothetical protein
MVFDYLEVHQAHIDSGSCQCRFYQSMWLPCVHLLSVYKKHNLSFGK